MKKKVGVTIEGKGVVVMFFTVRMVNIGLKPTID